MNGIHPPVSVTVKLTLGLSYTVMYCTRVRVLLPEAFLAVSEMVYLPGEMKVVAGLRWLDWLPLPRSHDQLFGLPVD